MLLFCISALGRARRISGADATQGHGSFHPSLQSPVHNVWRPFPPLPQFSQPNPRAPFTRAPPNLPPLFSQLSPTPQAWGRSSPPTSNSASRDRGRGRGGGLESSVTGIGLKSHKTLRRENKASHSPVAYVIEQGAFRSC